MARTPGFQLGSVQAPDRRALSESSCGRASARVVSRDAACQQMLGVAMMQCAIRDAPSDRNCAITLSEFSRLSDPTYLPLTAMPSRSHLLVNTAGLQRTRGSSKCSIIALIQHLGEVGHETTEPCRCERSSHPHRRTVSASGRRSLAHAVREHL